MEECIYLVFGIKLFLVKEPAQSISLNILF
jgi:hypothetical protein